MVRIVNTFRLSHTLSPGEIEWKADALITRPGDPSEEGDE